MVLFLSSRIRRWLFAVLILPLLGRGLERMGGKVGRGRPRAGRALTQTGQVLQAGRSRSRRRRGRRAQGDAAVG